MSAKYLKYAFFGFLVTLVGLAAISVRADRNGRSRRIVGSGDVITEKRDLSHFNRIESSGSLDLEITIGEPQEVRVTCDDNLAPWLKTEVSGDVLELYVDANFRTRTDCRVTMTVPALERLDMSGSGDAIVRGMTGQRFAYRISGSGDLSIAGAVEEFDVRVSGSGDVEARDLEAEDVRIAISGSGDATVYASRRITGKVSGSGDIRYYGDPEYTRIKVSGSGTISPVEHYKAKHTNPF